MVRTMISPNRASEILSIGSSRRLAGFAEFSGMGHLHCDLQFVATAARRLRIMNMRPIAHGHREIRSATGFQLYLLRVRTLLVKTLGALCRSCDGRGESQNHLVDAIL